MTRSAPSLPLFAKPADTQVSGRRAPWRRLTKYGVVTLVIVLTFAVGGAAWWGHAVSSKFDSERQVIDMGDEPGNAQPNMDSLRESSGDPAVPVSAVNKEDPPAAAGPVNILLLGSDRRPTADADDARSDSIMVAHIPQDRSSVQIMSLPRDLWVPIPGRGEGRINSAFTYGGPALTRDTVGDLLGTEIHHVMMIDFEGFADLTTALGGVTVTNPKEFQATHADGATFAQGKITLEGDRALQYVRERKAFTDSDFTRVQNQQRVMRAVFTKLLSSDTLTRPDRLQGVLDTALPYVSVDEDLTSAKLIEYGLQSRGMRASDISTFTIPTGKPFTTTSGAQVLSVNAEDLKLLQHAFSTETVDDYATQHRKG